MFHLPIPTTRHLAHTKNRVANTPVAGIALALPLGLGLWVIIFGILHAWL